MKYISLSFDDGRKDFIDNVVPILSKNDLSASVHVITGYIDRSIPKESGSLSNHDFLSIEECKRLKSQGYDVSSHSNSHCNSFDDICLSFKKIVDWGIYDSYENIGFSSPRSLLEDSLVNDLSNKLQCKYIRSGTKIKDRSFFYILIYLIGNMFKSKKCFAIFNKKYILKDIYNLPMVLPSIAVKTNIKAKLLKYLIQKSPDESLIIFNFHSIVKGKPQDKWDFPISQFNTFCKFLKESKSIKVVKLNDLKLFNKTF